MQRFVNMENLALYPDDGDLDIVIAFAFKDKCYAAKVVFHENVLYDRSDIVEDRIHDLAVSTVRTLRRHRILKNDSE